VNSLGEGNYETGLVPDQQRPDDLYHDFGLEEDWLKSSLTFIATGVWPAIPAVLPTVAPLYSGAKIKIEEDSPDYGKYIDNKRPL